LSHTDDPDPLLAVFDFSVDVLEPVWVFKRRNGIEKVDAMFAMIQGSFGVIPFVSHTPHTTGYR